MTLGHTGGPLGWPGHLPEWARSEIASWNIADTIELIVDAESARIYAEREGEAGFVDQLRSSVSENVRRLHGYVLGDVDLGLLDLQDPREFARTQAQLGISHGVLQSSYRLGTLTLWRDWSERLTATAESSDVADHDLAEAMRIMTDRIFTYQDFAMGLVSTSFTDHEQSLRRTGEQLRLGLVRDLIAGNDSVHPADSFMTLQYDLSINHVCGLFPGVANAVAAQVAQRVRGALPSVSTLVARLDAATVGVWFGRPKQWRPAQVAELVEQLMRCGVTVSLGDPGAGTEGFRSSYRDATRAQAVRRVWQKPPAVLRYSEVSLESMLVDDLETAEKFVAKELGELAEDTPAARRLRETLLASFSAGSHVATAEMINVHEHTVRNRLARIEEILGGTLATRRIELQVALRIKRLLDTSG